jgi:CheY-like chemotaxis protein
LRFDGAGDGTATIDLPKLDILVADDYHLNQKVISIMLKNEGHRIYLADNGLEAISALLRSRFDLILMDIHMPRLDGKAATRRIRSLPRPEGEIPIIALTADATLEQQKQCLAAGMNDYLTKPINLPELLKSIARCLPKVKRPETDDTVQAPITEPDFETETISDSIVDEAVLLEFAATVGWDTVAQLFETLTKDFADHRKIIIQAMESDETEVLRRQLQAVNGALGQFGATKAQETVHVIETMCNAGYSKPAYDLVPQFLNLADDSIVAVHHILTTIAPASSGAASSRRL